MLAASAATRLQRRQLGSHDCGRPGPTLLVLAGIHGNEPAGLVAVQRLLARLQREQVELCGRVLAFAGNLGALAAGRRFLDRDLNRRWLPAAVQELLARDAAGDCAEDREQRELLQVFDRVVREARGPVVFVDLHSSSADGPPFLCLGDTMDNRRLGLATGIPIILGIEEAIDGAALEWFSSRGIVNLALEGGRHDDADTDKNHEAALWLLLRQTGMLRRAQLDLGEHERQIARVTEGLPAIVEIVHRHAITAEDRFVMAPGFCNFAAVRRGTVLATDRNGELRAPGRRRLLLPLYQALGDDGYFLGRDVAGPWLRLAALLRHLRLDRLVHWLPGVRRDGRDWHSIVVEPRLARFFATEIFHLLGFRRERQRGGKLLFTRRWSQRQNRRLRPRR